ncbi:hypothetical protein KM043_008434 [Ampulex compressa]|nr:hypothetical protein KM043_008434 [Ampulex compressa]
MNDSFLEDLELIPGDPKKGNSTHVVDRHVTTRNATSSPLNRLQETTGTNLISKPRRIESPTITVPNVGDSKSSNVKDGKDQRRLAERDVKRQMVKTRVSDRKEKNVDGKLKPVENKVRSDKEHEIKDDAKVKLHESRIKMVENKNVKEDHGRRSGSCKENNRSSDLSTKENNHPSVLSGEGNVQGDVAKEKTPVRKLECSMKKSESKSKDPAVLLSAIKGLISTYTKEESTKILRAMQELHMNSQANLIKSLLCQTDELIKEMHPSRDSERMRKLIEENERLQEDVIILQRQNEDLRKQLLDFELLKEEVVGLKLKCMELSQQHNIQ